MSDKISCNVIQDLLVLYEDEACSEESCKLIEDHLSKCEVCRDIYEKAMKTVPVTMEDRQEEERFVRFAKKMKRKLNSFYIIPIALFLLLVLMIDYAWSEYFSVWINSVAAKDVKITELYQLDTGDISCTIQTDRPFAHITDYGIQIDGTPDGDNDEAWYELHFQYLMPWQDEEDSFYSDCNGKISFIFPMTQTVHYDYLYTCSSIFYTGKNKSDKAIIWKEGQSVEKAPPEIQKKADQYYLLEEEHYGYPIYIRSGERK